MAKWDYLRRAYAIKEYAYMRSIQFENYSTPEEEAKGEAELNTLPEVISDIENILEMAEDNFESARETPDEYKTIRQCKKFLADFVQERK